MKLIIVVVLLISGCGKTPELMIQLRDIDSHKHTTVKQAINYFFNTCPTLRQNITDIVGVQAKANIMQGNEWDYRTAIYGWEHYITVEIEIHNSAKQDYAAGHNIVYYLGGGDKPGFLTQKQAGQRFCGGMPINESADSYQKVAALSIIDSL